VLVALPPCACVVGVFCALRVTTTGLLPALVWSAVTGGRSLVNGRSCPRPAPAAVVAVVASCACDCDGLGVTLAASGVIIS
jgi:hypothetical protein